MRVLVIGAGAMGQMHARAFAQLQRVELVGICTRTQETGAPLAAELGVPWSPDPGAFDGVEASVVAVPTYVHRDWVETELARGRHVLCEVPFASSTAEADAMIAAAQAAGRLLCCALFGRFVTTLEEVRRRVLARDIGAIRSFRLERLTPPLARPGTADHYGDVIDELFVHDADIASWIFGPVTVDHVDCVVDDSGRIRSADAVVTAGRADGVIRVDDTLDPNGPVRTRLEVIGTEGKMVTVMRINAIGAPDVATILDIDGREPERVSVTLQDPYLAVCEYFARCVHGAGSPALIDAVEGRAARAAAEVARSAIRVV